MTFQELLNRIAEQCQKDTSGPGEMVVPSPELIAFNVRCVRVLRQLKVSSLASMADVSVSTIERVERAERVSAEALDKIAVALGQQPGYYTAPRRRKSSEEATAEMMETYGHAVEVEVRPLRTHLQVRELGCCHACLIHRPDLGREFDEDIDALREWLDLASFILDDFTDGGRDGEGRRRELYNSTLQAVRVLERRGVTVLAGTMLDPEVGMSDWKVAVLSITPRAIDPGASKRRVIWVDRRLTQFDQAKWDAALNEDLGCD